jgi:hypothetical protein
MPPREKIYKEIKSSFLYEKVFPFLDAERRTSSNFRASSFASILFVDFLQAEFLGLKNRLLERGN